MTLKALVAMGVVAYVQYRMMKRMVDRRLMYTELYLGSKIALYENVPPGGGGHP